PENVFGNDRHARMGPWTRRWIATRRLARATSTGFTDPRRPAWSMTPPTAPPVSKHVLRVLHNRQLKIGLGHGQDPVRPRVRLRAGRSVLGDQRARVVGDAAHAARRDAGLRPTPAASRTAEAAARSSSESGPCSASHSATPARPSARRSSIAKALTDARFNQAD